MKEVLFIFSAILVCGFAASDNTDAKPFETFEGLFKTLSSTLAKMSDLIPLPNFGLPLKRVETDNIIINITMGNFEFENFYKFSFNFLKISTNFGPDWKNIPFTIYAFLKELFFKAVNTVTFTDNDNSSLADSLNDYIQSFKETMFNLFKVDQPKDDPVTLASLVDSLKNIFLKVDEPEEDTVTLASLVDSLKNIFLKVDEPEEDTVTLASLVDSLKNIFLKVDEPEEDTVTLAFLADSLKKYIGSFIATMFNLFKVPSISDIIMIIIIIVQKIILEG